MTADDFADLTQARPTSRGKWVLKCPAHDDQAESLSISNGRDGRVQFFCSAGCHFYDFVEGFGFDYCEINSRPETPPQEALKTARGRAAYKKAQQERQIAHAAACARVRKLELIHDELGRRVCRMPLGAERNRILILSLNAESKLRHAEKLERSLRA